MKKSLLIFSLLLVFVAVFSQNIDENWVKENYYKKEYKIKMRDGVNLFTCAYMPKDGAEKHPILMIRTPYSCAPYGEDRYTPRLWLTYWKNYLKEKYIIVIQDVRGRWMSEGEFVDVRPFNPNKKNKTDIDEAATPMTRLIF